MAFNISPQINIFEVDNTTFVETKGDTMGAMAGYSRWGAANKVALITSGAAQFAEQFFKPDTQTALPFFVATDFLRYSNKMMFIRVVGDKARNSIVDTELGA
ncbi:hypothetical protein SHAb15599_00027 [Acinetobacter phage SH-Ab 15599]|nr:hypothetical protein SHAb15599_00027 [Acinetobacter phage SH-Ab 15599]